MNWCSVSPLILDQDLSGVAVPVLWGNRVRLDVLPPWLHEEDVASRLSYWQKSRLKDSSLVLIEEYQTNALGDLDPGWTGDRPRSIQDSAGERIQFVVLATWLAKPSPFSVELLIHARESEDPERWLIFQLNTLPRTSLGPNYTDIELNKENLDQSTALFDKIIGLERKGAVWTAIFTLWRALQEQKQGELRILLLWIVLEALFGPKDSREIRHRLSERMALFLSTGTVARQLYQDAKKGYDLRSKIAHGMNVGTVDPEEATQKMHQVQEWIRLALSKILISGEYVEIFSGNRREKYLDELAFE